MHGAKTSQSIYITGIPQPRLSRTAIPVRLAWYHDGNGEPQAMNFSETVLDRVQAGATFNITQSVVPGGGGLTTNGSLALTGSIGQPVVGASSGGSFSLSGGFWGGGSVVACPAIAVTPSSTSLPTGTVGASYTQPFAQTGVTGTIIWSLTGVLPSGLSFGSTTGVLAGTPTQSGIFNLTVRAADGGGCFGERAYSLTINCQAIAVTAPPINIGTVGASFSATFTQTGGFGTTAFSTNSALPSGLTLSPAGLLSGTPTGAGTFPITVRATDGNGCPGTVHYTLTINSASGPAIAALNPSLAPAGSASFILIVNGAGFTNNAIVRWNNSDRQTSFVSETQLRAVIPATDIATVGTASVTVFIPGSGTTSALPFAILSPVASVSAASFLGEEIAYDSIIAAFGVNLATNTELASTVPLPTTLSGTTAKVKDSGGTERVAPLFFVSSGQVNLLLPSGTTPGTAIITITNQNGTASVGNVTITAVAPGIFVANSDGKGVAAANVIRAKPDGSQITEQVAVFDSGTNRFVEAPIDLGPPDEQAFLILFGTGMRFRSGLSAVQLTVGGTPLDVLFLGDQGMFVGLDQLNARLPRSLADRGSVNVVLVVDGKQANTVTINIR